MGDGMHKYLWKDTDSMHINEGRINSYVFMKSLSHLPM